MTKKQVSIKRRSVSVYLPTNKMVDKWKRLAEKAGLSRSQYVQNIVEKYIKTEEAHRILSPLYKELDDIEREQKQLKKDALSQQEQIKILGSLTDEVEREQKQIDNDILDVSKQVIMLGSSNEGIDILSDIIDFLKERDVVEEQELLDIFCVDHGNTGSESVKVVNQLLEDMVNFNLIKRSNGEIIWV